MDITGTFFWILQLDLCLREDCVLCLLKDADNSDVGFYLIDH